MNETRMDELSAKLVPSGTALRDVSVDYRGLTICEWIELQWLRWRMAVAAMPAEKDRRLPPVTSARDNYGWRSLPSR